MERKIVLVLDFYLLFSENTICSNNIRVDGHGDRCWWVDGHVKCSRCIAQQLEIL